MSAVKESLTRWFGSHIYFQLRRAETSIVIQFSKEPTREVFEYLERYCAFQKDNAPTVPLTADHVPKHSNRIESTP